ncbi:MAG: hypothetical protein P1V51_25210 [Deltaproteobacteria bacterium]|nr:hypothetical protein [Deltaproteobacteria bacterium]
MGGLRIGLLGAVILLATACTGSRPEAREAEPVNVKTTAAQQALTGTARQAKGGAVIVGASGDPIYLAGLAEWPEALDGTPVEVLGVPGRRKLIPSPTVDAGGAISTGAEGDQDVLDPAPEWKQGLGRLVLVSGTARNAKAGPILHTPQGPLYLHAVGEAWAEEQLGRKVTAVGELLRKKRPSTPENDDSEFGGRTELTEEWALVEASWSLE